MPRPVFIPVSPHALALWDGSNGRQRRNVRWGLDSTDTEGVGALTAPPLRQARPTPVVMNGSLTPTSWIEALMQSTPGVPALGSTEELIELAEAIEYEMTSLLTPREKFVVEAIVFEQLSLREVAARWGQAWGKTQVARIRDAAYAKLATSERLRCLAGLSGTLGS